MAESSRIEDLRRRVQKDPASIAFAQLAEECRRAGDLDEAVSVCRAGLALHPTYLSARVTLGRALLELNQLGEAQTELQHVLRSAPENLAAIRALAETLHRQGDISNSLAQYRVALSLAKNDPDLQETVASLEHQLEAAAMVSEAAAQPETPAAPPEDIFAFLRSDVPTIAEAAIETSIAESSVVESPAVEVPAVIESPVVEMAAVDESPAFETSAVVEPPDFEAAAIVEPPTVEAQEVVALMVVEPPAVEALTIVEPPLETLPHVEALTYDRLPDADAVVETPIIEDHAVDLHMHTDAPPHEAIETLEQSVASDLDRLWAEPVSPLSGHPFETTTAPEPQIQWPTPDDDIFFAAPPVAPEPEAAVPAAYRLARERDAQTVAVLEQWLQAVHVSRTQRHA